MFACARKIVVHRFRTAVEVIAGFSQMGNGSLVKALKAGG